MYRILIKRISFLAISKGIERLSILAIHIGLSYILSRTYYGTFRQVLLIVNLLVPFFTLSLPMSIYYFFPTIKDKEKSSLIYGTILLLFVGGVILMFLLLGLKNFFGERFHNPILPSLLKIYALYGIIGVTISYYDALLVVLKKEKLLAVITIIFSIMMSIGAIFGAVLTKSVKFILQILLYLNALRLIIYILHTFNIIKPEKISSTLLKKELNYSLPIFLTSICDVATLHVDKIIVSIFFSAQIYAIYVNGAFEIPFLAILWGSIAQVLIPEFASLWQARKKTRIIELWKNFITKVSIIIFPAFVFLFIFAKPFMITLFPKNIL